MAFSAAHIKSGLAAVQARIAKAVQEADRVQPPTLVAISKLHPAEAVHHAALAGQVDFGENYVQEALAKQNSLHETYAQKALRWHFTGHIQSRKAKDVVGRFDLIHTVDSKKLARILNESAKQKNITQAILIQVNIGDEEQKSGIATHELLKLAEYILQCPNLELQGLMCLPPVFDAGLAARPHFAHLRQLRDDLIMTFGQESVGQLQHLSMGMSGDLEAAILEGATLVRVGTDIFGSRS